MSETREYIIDQAYSLFLSRSYEAVSISDISTAIGLTKGALYHHFINKEELFKAVINKYFLFVEFDTDIKNITLREFNKVCITNVRKIIENIFGKRSQYNPINYMSLIVDGFRHYEGFAERTQTYMEKEVKKIIGVLENAIHNGEIRKDINTNVVAQNYFSSALGLAGNILKTNSVEKAMNLLESQLNELYKLLKI